MNILFLNSKIQQCGVYQYGKRVCDILQNCKNINYIYKEIDNLNEYNGIISDNNINFIIYNYNQSTMPWLNEHNIQRIKKNIGIVHESPEHLFDIIISIDPTIQETPNKFTIPRPLFENINDLLLNYEASTISINNFINKYTDTNIPIIGSFGFGFANKGFDKIINMVNEQYDNAIIKLVIPKADFDPNPNTVINMINKCNNITRKPGIELMIINDFFSNLDLLSFLKSNTINIFLYDEMNGRGISSVIDYAISVDKPIGISNSYMFRNIYNDNICLYKTSIANCILNYEYIKKFKHLYSNENLIEKFNNIIYIMNRYYLFHGEKLENQYVDKILRGYFPDYNYKGIFIDIGAFEPIRISNSYHFEKNGWDCFLFEANTDGIPLLNKHRKNVFNYAIYDEDKDEVEFNVVKSNGWTAGFSALELSEEISKIFVCNDKEIKKINIKQRTLNTILTTELSFINNIDILKIDIEGGELKCLKGLDLIKFKPKIILLENISNDINIPIYLENYGYILDKHISYNQFYKINNL
jgi:FkbM family methyltransferase